jgi:hypothetical protein
MIFPNTVVCILGLLDDEWPYLRELGAHTALMQDAVNTAFGTLLPFGVNVN